MPRASVSCSSNILNFIPLPFLLLFFTGPGLSALNTLKMMLFDAVGPEEPLKSKEKSVEEIIDGVSEVYHSPAPLPRPHHLTTTPPPHPPPHANANALESWCLLRSELHFSVFVSVESDRSCCSEHNPSLRQRRHGYVSMVTETRLAINKNAPRRPRCVFITAELSKLGRRRQHEDS